MLKFSDRAVVLVPLCIVISILTPSERAVLIFRNTKFEMFVCVLVRSPTATPSSFSESFPPLRENSTVLGRPETFVLCRRSFPGCALNTLPASSILSPSRISRIIRSMEMLASCSTRCALRSIPCERVTTMSVCIIASRENENMAT